MNRPAPNIFTDDINGYPVFMKLVAAYPNGSKRTLEAPVRVGDLDDTDLVKAKVEKLLLGRAEWELFVYDIANEGFLLAYFNSHEEEGSSVYPPSTLKRPLDS